MFSRICKRLTYTNIVMTLALVFAMSGGAFAASKYLITSTKEISPKVLKALKGKNGTNGTNGTNGAPGAPGEKGAAGAPGANGTNGAPGTNGKDGKDGKDGKEGSPWTAGGTLPKGSSEEGEWNISQNMATPDGELAETSISFTVPLTAGLEAAHAHFINAEEGESEAKPAPAIINGECKGTFKGPKAASGNLCVFVQAALPGFDPKFETIQTTGGTVGTDTTGAHIVFVPLATGEFLAAGTWVVTG